MASRAWVSSDRLEYVEGIPAEWSRPGCYAVYLDGQLVYIGQSGNVRRRLFDYNIRNNIFACKTETPWGQADRVTVKFKSSVRAGDWLMREYRLIKRLKPSGNKVHTKRAVL